MANSAALVDTLKRELRARRLTYAVVAKHLGLSEVTVKRMFSKGEFTLARLDRICGLAGLEFSDLARALTREHAVISQLTIEQEKEFVANGKLMLVALCALNHWTYDQIVSIYDIAPAECVRLLARLEKLKVIELLPHNRIRLLISRAFAWIPDGPIQRLFKNQLQADFFRASFDQRDEMLLLANGSISKASLSALMTRLKRVAAEFADMRTDDGDLPFGERSPITMLLAARPWEPDFLRQFRRRTKSGHLRRIPSARLGYSDTAKRRQTQTWST